MMNLGIVSHDNLLEPDVFMNNLDESLKFTVLLTNQAHEIARQSIQGIGNSVKAKQVYRNSLAVYAVDYYLRCLGFNTDWLHSDSRNSVLTKLLNVADLQVAQVGKLECIPVSSTQSICEIPPESELERVGYLPVVLDDDLTQATILGLSQQQSGQIVMTRLLDLDESIEYLTKLEQPAIIKLGTWLDGLIDTGWETIDRLLSPAQLQLRGGFRETLPVIRCQQIDLKLQSGVTSLSLVIKIDRTPDPNVTDILLQVYPIGHHELPAGVKLTVVDDLAQTAVVSSEVGDNWIQLDFTANLGEEFTVAIRLDDREVIQKFAI
jgi:Protein of unknown function (DUF1822)